MNCRSCKASIRPGAQFCSNCGRKSSGMTQSQPIEAVAHYAPESKPKPVSLNLSPIYHQRRSFFPIALVVILLAGLAIGGNYLFGPYFGYTLDYSSPQATIRTWAAAVKSANPKALTDCYAENRREAISSQNQADLENALKQLNKSLIKLDIIESKITGRTAKIIVTVVGRGADGIIRAQAEEFALMQESSQWKFDAADTSQKPTIIDLAAESKHGTDYVDPFSSISLAASNGPHFFQISKADENIDVDNPQFATGPEDGHYAVVHPEGELVLKLDQSHFFHNGSGRDIRLSAKTTGPLHYRVWVRSTDHGKWVEIDLTGDQTELLDLSGLSSGKADSIKIRNTGRASLYVDAVEAFYVDGQ